MAGTLVATEEKVGVVLDVESTVLSIGLRVMLEDAGLPVSSMPSVIARCVVMCDASRIAARSREENLLAILAEVLRLLVQGDSTAEIARQLCIAQQTVKQHVSMLIGLDGVRSRAELVAKVTGHHRQYCAGRTVGGLDHGRS